MYPNPLNDPADQAADAEVVAFVSKVLGRPVVLRGHRPRCTRASILAGRLAAALASLVCTTPLTPERATEVGRVAMRVLENTERAIRKDAPDLTLSYWTGRDLEARTLYVGAMVNGELHRLVIGHLE